VITVENLPEYLVAGKPTTLTFVIRQHGRTLSDGTRTIVTASDSSGRIAKADAKPTGKAGQYKAELSVPDAGLWTIQVESDLGQAIWRPIKAIRSTEPTPAPLSPAVRGEHLFLAKGCITCHVNKEIAGRNFVPDGPELTGRKYPADNLKKFLADPEQNRTKTAGLGPMPNLNLSRADIDALEAFINRDRTTVAAN
jgi:cytochrome c551/c552